MRGKIVFYLFNKIKTLSNSLCGVVSNEKADQLAKAASICVDMCLYKKYCQFALPELIFRSLEIYFGRKVLDQKVDITLVFNIIIL